MQNIGKYGENMRRNMLLLTLILCMLLAPVAVADANRPIVELSQAERAYLQALGPITMGVDPDWVPFEHLDTAGNFTGIAADLVALIAERLGVKFEVVITGDWSETLERSRAGDFLVVPFLNQTAAREEWLIFTEPLFVDSNVFITREEHPYIANPAELSNKTLVLPEGTSMEEFVRRDFPNINIVTTETEMEAFRMVANREADMTLRSLIIAAYTIRKEGFFSLKIAGHIPAYTNYLRMGILASEPMLQSILNKAIATITPQEREQIVNRHVYIRIEQPADLRKYLYAIASLGGFAVVIAYWAMRFRRLSEEHKQLLDEARRASENIEQIIEFLPDATFVVNAEGKVTHWNKSMEEMTGVTKQDMVGLGDYAYSIPLYRERRPLLINYALNGIAVGVDNIDNYSMVRADNGKLHGEIYLPAISGGKGGYVLAAAAALRNSRGENVGAIETVRNISERKAMEEQVLFEKERYLTTLMSIGDGVISTDREARVLSMNRVAEELTGWSQTEAQGIPFDEVFTVVDETSGQSMQNMAVVAVETGSRLEMEDSVILRSRQGRERAIAQTVTPIRDDQGVMYGAVVVFRDITEKKEEREQIRYLSFHDQLTGLYNRRFFETELQRLNTARNLPLTLVMLDANGLKLVNDAFGHMAGDEVLVKVARALKQECRADDIVARIGGDEFVVLLPQTPLSTATTIASRVVAAVSRERVESVFLSVSFGCASKSDPDEDMSLVFKRAEDDLYRRKLEESTSMRHKTMNVIVNTLYEKSEREEQHAQRVSRLTVSLATALGLPAEEIGQLRMAAQMHDIGKIALPEQMMQKSEDLTEAEWREMHRHPEIGYRILSSLNEMAPLAEWVLAHHERWDGKGYPKGLSGTSIPLGARIIAVADAYETMVSDKTYQRKVSQDVAATRIREAAGTQFDPEVARAFVERVLGLEWEG